MALWLFSPPCPLLYPGYQMVSNSFSSLTKKREGSPKKWKFNLIDESVIINIIL